jgi:hypothetical protein
MKLVSSDLIAHELIAINSAFCKFIGSTLVSHDSEGMLVATSCSNPGCYTRDVAYNATMRQMTVLTELSASCRQFIKVISSN